MGKNPVEMPKAIFLSVVIFNKTAMLAAILKNKVHELGAKVENMLYTRKNVEIRT